MTREEILLEALGASMEREREMAERLLEFERKLDGWEPDDGPVTKIEEVLADRFGVTLRGFAPVEVNVEKSLHKATRLTIVAVETRPSLPDGNFRTIALSAQQATEAFKRFAQMTVAGGHFTLNPEDLRHPNQGGD